MLNFQLRLWRETTKSWCTGKGAVHKLLVTSQRTFLGKGAEQMEVNATSNAVRATCVILAYHPLSAFSCSLPVQFYPLYTCHKYFAMS